MVLDLVISGAVGGGLTLVATWGEYYRRHRDRRERTRAALIAEPRTMLEPIESWSCAIVAGPIDRMTNPPVLETNPVVSEVYDARASELGLFDTEAVERVTLAYSVAKRLERRLERVHDAETVQESRMFGLLADVVQLHLFINLAIRQLEGDQADRTDLSWPRTEGKTMRADEVRELLLQRWDLGDEAIISFQLDYQVRPPADGGMGEFDLLAQDAKVMTGE